MPGGETVSKASVRSVSGVNIIEYLRGFSEYYINCGGHPMAAGFTLKTEIIDTFKQTITAHAKDTIDSSLLVPHLTIDAGISLEDISMDLFHDLETLKPFGMGNREPVFCVDKAQILEARTVGKTGDHLKMMLQAPSGTLINAIGFGFGSRLPELKTHCSLAFTIEDNVWNSRHSLQLHIKDIITASDH